MTPKTEWHCIACDKCGTLVQPENSALRLDIAMDEIQGISPLWLVLDPKDRCLKPTKLCVGSPSRRRLLRWYNFGKYARLAKKAYLMIQR